ncbi:MAG: hypothetical protein JSR59_10700 [Proteobacteria bacterium]|nr:hypothetical protein [Pseudomonadota bacterium]MBS0595962.1 hypothetical protein [Pseudomonadota bacterium]
MKFRIRAAVAAGALVASASATHAVEGADAERAAIRRDRADAEAEFERRKAECETRFVVTSCVDMARREEREALTRLRHRETALDDAERKERAAQRRGEIADNQQRDRERQSAASSPEGREALHRQSEPQVMVRPQPQPQPRPTPRPAASGVGAGIPLERRTDEARSRAEFEARQQAAEAHRKEVEQRNLERAARGKVSAPLPPASAP